MKKKFFKDLLIILFIIGCFVLTSYQKSNAQNAQGHWALVMSQNHGFTDQVWRTRNYFPNKEIQELWDQDYAVTSLSFNDDKWALVMSKGTGYGYQYWSTTEDFPEQRIEDYWDKGYRITHLTYGSDNWALIMTQKSGYTGQIWRTRSYFPKDEIEEFWNKGYYITNLSYGNGMWALVMSQETGYTDQYWYTRESFPKPEIREAWDEGFSITNLTYGDGVWAVVMTEGTGLGYQVWRTRDYFPEKEIAEQWDKSYDITGIYSGYYSTSEEPTATYTKPEIHWNVPYANNIKTSKSEYTIKACVASETSVSKVSLYVNNNLQVSDRGYEIVPDDGCDYTIERKINLTQGINQLKLVVENKGGSNTAELRTVVYETPKMDPPPAVTTQKRLALIIGNSKYTHSPLKNPANDARSMATTLEKLGFDVLKYEDINQSGMKRAIDEFGSKLKGYDIGLFFYAGHGLQVKGNNYLIPLQASIGDENDVEYECVNASRVLAKMESSGNRVNIVVLDACRDNPFERSWSRSTKGNGLASMDAPLGSIVCYATSPGKTASDGSGNNGLYTEKLLKYMNMPGLKIEDVFKRVRIEVVQDSNKEQTPWETSSLIGDFYFNK